MRQTRLIVLFLAAQSFALASHATAGLYKWVDEKGTINYSATPPNGKDAKQMRADPALSTSNNCNTAQCFNSEASKAERKYRREEAAINSQESRAMMASERARMQYARQKALEDQRALRRERLVRECERNRQTDCHQDATLQRLEDQNQPISTLRRRAY